MFINGELINKKFSVQRTTKLKNNISQSIYDPRIDNEVYSDNPALILAQIITQSRLITVDDDFWNSIKILANYCDTTI